jgi:hypothetical protein
VRRYLGPSSTLEVQIDISRIYNSNRWQQFKKNDRLVFVVCGSASSWIEENLLDRWRRLLVR